jgi:hypothetical protein
MNWKLVLQLSMFGIAMGLAIVFFIPSKIEPILWLIIFVLSAYAIAQRCARLRFLNGLMVGLFDSLLKTTTHVIFFSAYLARHQQEIAMIRQITTAVSPLQLILLTSPVWGLVYGTITGLLALLIGIFVQPAAAKVDQAV